MRPVVDSELVLGLGLILALLVVLTTLGWALERRAPDGPRRSAVSTFRARTRSIWPVFLLLALALLGGERIAIVMIALVSALVLREYFGLVGAAATDRRAVMASYVIVLPAQYLLVAAHGYGFYIILIPVYVFLLLPILIAVEGDTERFLQRTATIQWGILVGVYALSHAAALLTLDLTDHPGESAELLLWFILVVQSSDLLQYVIGRRFGKKLLAPKVSPHKTVEGLVGGLFGATVIGGGLWWLTPYAPQIALVMALVAAVIGFFGGLVMSAIKRDRHVKDFGSLLPGHGGILDRVDSLCFSAPIVFHLTRFFFTVP